MSEQPVDPLAESREQRDSARSVLTSHIEGLKTGLQTRPISRRLSDEALARAKAATDEARAIALENKGVIAATLAALVAWFLRKPIQRGYERVKPGVSYRITALVGRIRERVGQSKDIEDSNDA